MKTPLFVFLFLASALPLAAQTTANAPATRPAAPDLVTLSGQTYHAARVGRVEPDGITYFFSGGVVKIPFTDLPEAVRKQYGYDPQKAAAFAAQDADAQERARQANDQERAEANKRAVAAAKAAADDLDAASKSAPVDAAPKPPMGSSHTLTTGSLDDAPESRTPVNGTVIQIIDEGLLVAHGDRVVLLEDYPKQDAIIDDAVCRATGQLEGSFEYEPVRGGTSRIARYHFISGTVTNPK